MGGFCLLVELHWEGSAHAACAAGLFLEPLNDYLYLTNSEQNEGLNDQINYFINKKSLLGGNGKIFHKTKKHKIIIKMK